MDEKDNVSTAVKALQIHQLKKAVERAKAGEELTAADMRLLERFDSEKPATCPEPKKKRGRPMKAEALAKKIELQALEEIHDRQERGEKLTGADYAFLAKMKLQNAEPTAASNVLQMPLPEQSRSEERR